MTKPKAEVVWEDVDSESNLMVFAPPLSKQTEEERWTARLLDSTYLYALLECEHTSAQVHSDLHQLKHLIFNTVHRTVTNLCWKRQAVTTQVNQKGNCSAVSVRKLKQVRCLLFKGDIIASATLLATLV